MIRHGITRFSSTAIASPLSSRVIASTVVTPVAIVLSGQFPYRKNHFSTNPKRNHEVPIGVGDTTTLNIAGDGTNNRENAMTKKRPDTNKTRGPVRYNGPIFPSLLRGGFDDFFSPSLFGRDPLDIFRHDPFFSRRRGDGFFDYMVPTMMLQRRPFPPDGSPASAVNHSTEKSTTFLRSSPGYRIKESKDVFEISVDIPDGMDAADMQVELEEDGTVLHISGEKKAEKEGFVSHQWFNKRFVLGPNVEADKMTANFDNNVLVLTAPNVPHDETVDENKRVIPINTVKAEITKEELVEKNFNDAFDESDWAETGKTAALEEK